MDNSHELPLDRLATTDQRGNRIYLYPADVRGKWRIRRTWVSGLLLVVFLVLPWVKIGGYPAVLLDIPHRRFAFFGVAFWAHEAPLLALVIGSGIITLALATAIFGRIWCGWACPQTVFVDTVFRRIERWIEGDAFVRKKLDEGSWSFGKFGKKTIKWVLFTLAALLISHSFLAYFVGPEALAQMIVTSPAENPTSFSWMLGMVAFVLFDFGWFREQFCTVVCPYGRFQSVLMDADSMTVAYDLKRGEPRRGLAPPGQSSGDCVNCYRCVQVCPTGIDIRRGVQLECVGCTACIDACDEVMTRIKKPEGLIRYSSEANLAKGERVGSGFNPRATARSGVYAVILLVMLLGLVLTLHSRRAVEISLIRAVDSPYQELQGSRVSNHFKLDLRNQSFNNLRLGLAVSEELKAKGVTLVRSNQSPELIAGESERSDLFVQYPKDLLTVGKAQIQVQVDALNSEGRIVERLLQEVTLVGPY